MDYLTLGRSDLKVSRIALGTMTFGRQNTEEEAFAQLDYALERGVNLIDAAEMYPVPTAAEFQGRTEAYIGNWLQARGTRDKVILATKATGPGDMVSYLRPDMRHDARNLRLALEGSLKRLQTDYIDLYQLHWPDRSTNYFGQLGYEHKPENPGTPLEETLSVLGELVQEGKIRYIGLSNETPWGTMKCLQLADALGLPRIQSVQNPYSLLNRTAEVGLAEVMLREDVGLLAYSPLGFGVLSGKYAGGARPEGSRLALFPEYRRYLTEQGVAATECYLHLAAEFGLDPAQMALAYVNSRPFLGSNIIGATRLEQLKANLDSLEVRLSPELLAKIEAIHQRYPNPCP
ncbi:NADP(H)-dependent aldo-keto reductase [Marinobacterium sp. AK62]|uniref:NADP(H)-dependent aldo-keto reductase n=1 Tax=Marinobacterium alkalitolerans TaxID=1542925 RepID=A0ABS3ZEL5_9GAMM|nr:NADP(H)-dependent aldo-keto reductase [Marinobacterium alkalitolerans]MBP0050041.1 NADP(H)-dependent aldo-keto reductase [Marinobacterium alkalitolerans]